MIRRTSASTAPLLGSDAAVLGGELELRSFKALSKIREPLSIIRRTNDEMTTPRGNDQRNKRVAMRRGTALDILNTELLIAVIAAEFCWSMP